MKILIVHNDYGAYSGEEAVVDKMALMLAEAGHSVSQLRMSTAGLRDSLKGKIAAFFSGIYSPAGIRAMHRAIERERPDVINIHNLFPFIGPAALRECQRAGIPVVMTVHNYRLICPTGLFMRNGLTCELCLQKNNEWSCIRHNCENSAFKSIAYAARNFIARKRRHYLNCVDRFACITRFQRDKLVRAGFPPEKIVIIPNSIDAPADYQHIKGEYVAYCGRLSHEKGIDLIIEAARRNPDIPFRLAGKVSDPLLTADLPANITLSGHLSGDELLDFYRNARFCILASRCYEGFPMAVLEAARFGKPMVAPAHGPFPEIISGGTNPGGLLFAPGDARSLEKNILSLWSDPALTATLGQNAFSRLKSRFSSQAVAPLWCDLISSLIAH
ncbi:MAG: glycosyltransferase family 4 protein [Muribaculaceae bacterium]|nr:glycosyltransferase family 4 protein [Muribaculaceae bacterium]